MKVAEEHLELATKALQETIERFTTNGIDRGALVIAMLSLALHNLAIVDGPKSWPKHYTDLLNGDNKSAPVNAAVSETL